jgi:superfamily II DNA/RNA helicase
MKMTFAALGLDARLCTALEKMGFTQPTPVQQQAIPLALKGQDVMASAQTGTGKTAAFVLPALNRIISGPSKVQGRGPRILVLTPTRELATQVFENFKSAATQVRVTMGVMVGGVAYGPQMMLLQKPLDVLVSTPGRLIDHMNEGRVDFSRVEVLVLDEADKMLDMGFLKPVEKVLGKIEMATHRPQMLLFTATFTKVIEQFAGHHLKNPAKVSLAPAKVSNAQITQKAYRADSSEHKYMMLEALLEEARGERVLVFSATKYGAERLAKKLVQAGYTAEALHGGMAQNVRKRTLGKMHTGDVQVLVATDVAARGIDVKQLGHVINFDLPQVAEDYVHRIGRTGRAGDLGVAISLVATEDYPMLKEIEKVLGKKVELLIMKGFEPDLTPEEFNRLGAAAPKSRQKKKVQGSPRSQSAGPKTGGQAHGHARGAGDSAGSARGYGFRKEQSRDGKFSRGASSGDKASRNDSYHAEGGSRDRTPRRPTRTGSSGRPRGRA